MQLRSLAAAIAMLGASAPSLAQDAQSEPDTLNRLLACRSLSDDAARLACQDEQLAVLAQATESGRIVVVERRALREVERASFGLNLPSVGRLGGILRRNDAGEAAAVAEVETLEDGSTATYDASGALESLVGVPVSDVSLRNGMLRVTLGNGQIWAQTDSTRLPRISNRALRDGVTADIETGVLGAHFLRLSNHPSRRFRAERVQ